MNALRLRGYLLRASEIQQCHHRQCPKDGSRLTSTAASGFRRQIVTVGKFVPRTILPVSGGCGGSSAWQGHVRRASLGEIPTDAMYLPMPKLSPSMTTGTVTKWLKAEGDEINEYDAVLELSTDSLYAPGDAPTSGPTSMVVELAEVGFVGKLFAAVGDTVKVGHPIMSICEEDENLEALRNAQNPGVDLYGDSPRLRIATFQGYLNGVTPKT